MQKALFGAGCFWGIQAAFDEVKGVLKTTVGYAGGDVEKPTYKQVCSGETGHAEVVLVEFDEKKVSYEKLLKVFWKIHDPTQLNKQGPDHGTQYRSVIFFYDDEQEKIAIKSRQDEQQKYDKPIVTQIMPFTNFYLAEKYHQKYLEKTGKKTC